MHVNVSVRAKLRAFAAADAPILDDDLEVFFPPDGTDRALRHTEWIPARAASGGDEILIITQAITEQTRNPIVRLCASLHAGIATRAISEIDQEEVLRFKESLIQVIVKIQTHRYLHPVFLR